MYEYYEMYECMNIMNVWKLAYLRLHDQIFPYQLKLWCKTIARNSSSKEFQENNIEFRMSSNLVHVLCPGECLFS